MKRSNPLIAVIVLIVVIVGGFLIFHKSSKPAASSSSTTKSSQNTPAVNNAVLITKTGSNGAQYLADPSGKPLYTYGADTSGVSNCTGSCLADWPVYQATGSTTSLPSSITTIKRTDNGQTQYAYMGKPLYYFTSDTAGKAPTGDGVSNFKIAKPEAASSSQSTTTTTTNSTSSSPNYNY